MFYRPDDLPPQFSSCIIRSIGNTILPFFLISGREKFILVAHDWGGAIAWNFVRKHHDMLQSYIILNAPYTPMALRIVFSNAKQFFMSW
jgi:pimeloyl-ACP methyl ester carboxylesterase